ncbi:acetolactate synthase small subunit, partial [Campylobacter jejuni]|nr:acetolactate synthase small subunit [Campylobacter jejuni]
ENLGGLDAVLKAYNGTIANSNENFLFLMVADDANRIDNFLKQLKYNPSDIVRSGSVLMEIK